MVIKEWYRRIYNNLRFKAGQGWQDIVDEEGVRAIPKVSIVSKDGASFKIFEPLIR